MKNEKTQMLREKISALVEEYADIILAPQKFIPGSTAIPPSGKLLSADELKKMVEASLDGWLTTGRFDEEFKERLAKFLGVT